MTCFFEGPKRRGLFEVLREKLTGGGPLILPVEVYEALKGLHKPTCIDELRGKRCRHEIGEAMDQRTWTYLAIGGPADGKFISVAENMEEIRLPQLQEKDGEFLEGEFRYRRVYLTRDIRVLVPAGDDSPFRSTVAADEVELVLLHLLKNYRPLIEVGRFRPFPPSWKPIAR